jgi:hypothetical protein
MAKLSANVLELELMTLFHTSQIMLPLPFPLGNLKTSPS